MPSARPLPAESAAPRRWLSIVGIGEDGVDGLSAVARGLVADAEIVFGGKRHLELAAPLIRGADCGDDLLITAGFDEARGRAAEAERRIPRQRHLLADYHAGLVPPFCLSAVKSFFDAH